MRKGRLLQIAPVPPYDWMLAKAATDRVALRSFEGFWRYPHKETTYGTSVYYTAKREEELLVIAAYRREALVAGDLRPVFVTYIDTEEGKWASRVGEKWSEAYLLNLNHMAENYEYYRTETESPEDIDLCNELLGRNEKTIVRAVHEWQSEIRGEQSRKKAQKREDYWKSQMDKIPALPDDFALWADMEGTAADDFLFFRRVGQDTQVYCSHCGGVYFTRQEMRHCKEVRGMGPPPERYFCRECRAYLPAKSWGKQKTLRTRGTVLLMQKAGGQVAFRNFLVTKNFRLKPLANDKVWEKEVTLSERLRVLANPETFESEESYEQRTVQPSGKFLWATVTERGYHGTYSLTIGRGVPYMRNLDEVLEGTGCRPSIARMFVKGAACYMQTALKKAAKRRYIEYLVRAGLTNLTREIVEDFWKPVDEKATNLRDLLGVDGQQLHQLKRLNGGSCMLEAMRYAWEHDEKISEEHLRFIHAKSIDVDALEMDRTGMTLQRMINYIRKQAEISKVPLGAINGIYHDYLDLAEERGMDLTDEIVCHTPRLEEMHNRYADEKNRRQNEAEAARVNKLFRGIEKDYQDNLEHFAYQKAGLVIMVPRRASDIQEEGRKQHHCVGASDNYIRKMAEGESFILFLRKAEAPEIPYYTLEVKYDGEILQSYGAYDRKPDIKKVEPVLKSFTRKIRKRTEAEKKAEEGILAPAG